MTRRIVSLAVLVALAATAPDADAQFRRGILSETFELTMHPLASPATLLPSGSFELEVRNATGAPARIVERFRERLTRQLADNDARLTVATKDGAILVIATLVEWNESRRNSTKYVSERRQIGTREVTDSKGKKRTEPVYEQGRTRRTVEISGNAGVRMEARRHSAGTALADQSARHSLQQQHFADEGVPSRDVTEDELLDAVVAKAAAQITPSRGSARVLLARSDEVDRLNALAQGRRWQEWLTGLETLKPHRDAKRDAYRLHNLAVAQEALAYEAPTVEDGNTRLALANDLITRAATQNPGEKYIADAAERIADSKRSYQRLVVLYAEVAAAEKNAQPIKAAPTATSGRPSAATPAPARVASGGTGTTPTAPMSNQDVIELRSAGLDDDNLIAAITAAKAVTFDLSPSGLKELLAGKVSNRVIATMRGRRR